MWRLISLHWPKLSAVGLLYCALAAGVGYLTNLQLDEMHNQARHQAIPLHSYYSLNDLTP